MPRRFTTVACTIVAGLLAVSAPAAAEPTEDARADRHDGNVTTCQAAGLPGTEVEGQLTVSIAEGTYLTVSGVPSDLTLTGVVVKGGPAYNVYPPNVLEDLRSPLNGGGQVPAISHWFACATGTAPTDTPTDTPTETTTESPAPSEPGSSAPADTSAPTTTDAAVAGESDELAATGFSSAVPLTAGVVLVLLGAALVFVVRRRGLSRG